MAVDTKSGGDECPLEKPAKSADSVEKNSSSSPLCEQHKKEGNEFYAAGEYAKAVNAYNKAVKIEPDNGVLYSNRAAAFLQLGKEIKAIKDAEQAIALKPDWAKGYFRKGGALVALRRWDEAIEVLKKALELEPKSKEISAMLRDTMRKRTSENGDKKREDAKGLKLVASDKNLPGDSRHSGSSNSDSSGTRGVPIGFSEAVIEQFVRDSLESAMNQFAAQGTIKSIVYMQPSTQGETLQMIGIEAGFDSPQANEQCVAFLRTHCADHKALAVLVLAEKKNIAYPQIWKEKSSSKWKWKDNESGIFMQLDAYSVGGVGCGTERKVWFIPTPSDKSSPSKPQEPVELDIGLFAIMPPLLRNPT